MREAKDQRSAELTNLTYASLGMQTADGLQHVQAVILVSHTNILEVLKDKRIHSF